MDFDELVNWFGGAVVLVLGGICWPTIVHQATSDEGDGLSGAVPGFECWCEPEPEQVQVPVQVPGNSLPPTCEF